MVFITNLFLRNLIFLEISKSIQVHRDSKNKTSLFKLYEFALDREIDDFISSTPYYCSELKELLMRIDSPSVLVSKNWLKHFENSTKQWALSDEWLYYDAQYINDPSINKTADRKELGLPAIDFDESI